MGDVDGEETATMVSPGRREVGPRAAAAPPGITSATRTRPVPGLLSGAMTSCRSRPVKVGRGGGRVRGSPEMLVGDLPCSATGIQCHVFGAICLWVQVFLFFLGGGGGRAGECIFVGL